MQQESQSGRGLDCLSPCIDCRSLPIGSASRSSTTFLRIGLARTGSPEALGPIANGAGAVTGLLCRPRRLPFDDESRFFASSSRATRSGRLDGDLEGRRQILAR